MSKLTPGPDTVPGTSLVLCVSCLHGLGWAGDQGTLSADSDLWGHLLRISVRVSHWPLLSLPALAFPREAIPLPQDQGASSAGEGAPGGHGALSSSEVGHMQSVIGSQLRTLTQVSCFLAAATAAAITCALIHHPPLPRFCHGAVPYLSSAPEKVHPGTQAWDVLEVTQSGSPGLPRATQQPALPGLAPFPSRAL